MLHNNGNSVLVTLLKVDAKAVRTSELIPSEFFWATYRVLAAQLPANRRIMEKIKVKIALYLVLCGTPGTSEHLASKKKRRLAKVTTIFEMYKTVYKTKF